MSEGTKIDEILEFEVEPSFKPRFVVKLVRYHSESDRYCLRCELADYLDPGSWETQVSEAVVDELLSELGTIRLAPIPDFAMGLDGTTYRVAMNRGWNKLVVQWWGHVPTQWVQMVPFLRRVVALAGSRAAGVQVE